MPDFSREAAYGGRVAGVDEVGRGPLAGPVLAAAVMFTEPPPDDVAAMIDDSKKISPGRRQRVYSLLRQLPSVHMGVAAASVSEIARLNIRQAAFVAMKRAVERLPLAPDMVLVDGLSAPQWHYPTQCIVRGDALSLSIAAASIIAKVTRDRLMWRLAQRFPSYGWEHNAGYATAQHRAALLRDGPCKHHRQGFGLVKSFFSSNVIPEVSQR